MEEVIEKQNAILENIEKIAKQDKMIQLSQAALQLKTDNDLNKDNKETIKHLSKIEETLNKALMSNNNKSLNSNIQKMYEALVDTTNTIKKAESAKTYRTTGDYFKEKKQNVKEFFTLRGFLDKMGIVQKGTGGLFDTILAQREEEKKRIQQQLSATRYTFDKGTKEEKIRKASAKKQIRATNELEKQIQQNQKSLQEYAEAGFTEKQITKTPEYQKQQTLAVELKKTSKKYKDLDKESTVKQQKKEKKEEASAMSFSEENTIEKDRQEQKKIQLLQKIADNTASLNKDTLIDKKTSEKQDSTSLLDGIFSLLSSGFLKAVKFILSPKNILKAFTKFFAPAMLIGSLVNGIIDGFKTYTETGNFAEALISGLGGVLEFLTFGLFDKDTIKNISDAVGEYVDEYIIQPINGFIDMLGNAFDKYIKQPFVDFMTPIADFFKSVKDNIVNFITNFEIPKIGFTIPYINKEISIGPFKPFSSDKEQKTAPSSPAPSTANTVYTQSANNAEMSKLPQQAPAPVIVNAPTTTNVSRQNIAMPAPIRNDDAGFNRYLMNNSAII